VFENGESPERLAVQRFYDVQYRVQFLMMAVDQVRETEIVSHRQKQEMADAEGGDICDEAKMCMARNDATRRVPFVDRCKCGVIGARDFMAEVGVGALEPGMPISPFA
jgi:hypothetical protein